jgi:hypothetical protein
MEDGQQYHVPYLPKFRRLSHQLPRALSQRSAEYLKGNLIHYQEGRVEDRADLVWRV